MGSGARRSGRIDGEGRRGRSLEMMTMVAARGPSGRVRRRGGRGRHCGARERVGEERGWWWPRRMASVATGLRSVEERGSQRKGGEGTWRVRGLGGCVASRTGSRATRGSRRWPGGSRRWPRPLGRAPRLASVRPPGRGGRGQGGGGGLGRPDGAGPGKWRQVSGPGGLLSLLFLFCFSFLFLQFVFALI